MRRHRKFRTTLLAILGLLAALIFIQPGSTASAAAACPQMVYSAQQANGAANVLLEQNCASQDLSARYQTVSAVEPQLSPNGEQLAYADRLLDYDYTEVQLVVSDADGVGPSRPSNGANILHPSWSPDSHQLVAVKVAGTSFSGTLVLVTIGPDKSFTVTPTSIIGDSPNWCRDGSIVYAQDGHIWRMNADQSDNQQLTDGPAYDDHPACTPDSNYVVYDSQPNGSVGPNISVVGKLGGATAQLTQLDGYNQNPTVSGDWTLAFSHEFSTLDTSAIYTLPLGGDSPAPDPYTTGDWQSSPTYWQGDQASDPPANWPPAGLTPPVPPTNPTPTLSNATVGTPKPTDKLLTRSVSFKLAAGSAAAKSYDYGWASSATATEPSSALQHSSTVKGTLDYRPTKPDQNWYLFARGVTASGTAGAWFGPVKVHTPKAPVLIGLGDSITSGHHQDYTDKGKTVCHDDNYGYAAAFSKTWLASLPSAWRTSNQYLNVAESGFSTQAIAKRNSTDACKKTITFAPLDRAKTAIVSSPQSWDRVVITAGVNDTNWGPTITKVIEAEIAKEAITRNPLANLDQPECSLAMSGWNGTKASVQSSITTGIKTITRQLHAADSAAAITWLGYYDMAGTGTNKIRTWPYVPSACSQAIQRDVNVLNGAILAALPAYVHYVPMDSAMHENNSRVQPLMTITGGVSQFFNSTNPPGWPHPNQSGGTAIASLLNP